MIEIRLEYLIHRGKEWIAVHTQKNQSLNRQIRRFGARWTNTHRCWLIPCTQEIHRKFVAAFAKEASINQQQLKESLKKRRKEQTHNKDKAFNQAKRQATGLMSSIGEDNIYALRKLLETLHLKAYSPKTIRTYRNEFIQLLMVLGKIPVDQLTVEHLRRYLEYCIVQLGLREATIHSRINAIKFYFEQVLNRDPQFFEIPRPKKPLQLPRFFNQSEIAAIIQGADNLKHRVMLMLAYSTGMRVSEVVAIRSANIDSSRMCIRIEAAKGKKDRMVKLSPVLLVMLREYWKAYKPPLAGYLFEGQFPNQPYSTRSLQLVLQKAKQKAGILKPGSVHALRHSFATHLLDKGTDVTTIIKLLGHNDIKTTLRYLHVTNRDMLQVFSPLDDLQLDPRTNLRNPLPPAP